MSLLKQLLISVSVAILAILFGTLALSIGAARQYLDGQLQSQSENSVSALALSLSQPANQDEVTRELLMMALFDSGQFRSIRLVGTDGHTLFERTHSADEMAGIAPRWFSAILPLTTPEGVRVISDGWKQVGKLSVVVDNTYARDALWQSTVRMFLLVVVSGLVWALFVIGLLRWFRRVLHEEVVAQVQAIGSQQPRVSNGRPRVAELAEVVWAIGDTRERVRATTQEQTERIESLQLELHQDPVTKLPNRKYFMNELRRVLQEVSQTPEQGGHVMLFRQRDLPALNAQLNRVAADNWLAEMGRRVKEVLALQGLQDAQVARLNGSDFVILLPGLEGLQAMHVVQQVRQSLQAQRVALAGGNWCRWAYSLTDYGPNQTVSDVMSRLDHALMRAESAGHNDVEYDPQGMGDAGPQHGRDSEAQWHDVLASALSEPGHLSLSVQQLRSAGEHGADVRDEASLVLHDASGKVLTGALFLPVAVRLGLSGDFDLRAIALGQTWLAAHPGQTLVVRVSLPSLAHRQFVEQMGETLRDAQVPADVTQRLILELDAHGLIAYPEEVKAFCDVVTEVGAGVALRRLDQQPMALVRLHTMPLRYVKLGGEFAGQAQSSPGSLHLLEAMADTARSLGVRVYVTDMVDDEVAAMLRSKGASLPVQQEGA